MYLICCPDIHMKPMVESLATINIEALALPLLSFEFDAQQLEFVEKNIDSFDYVVLSSPSCIDFIKNAIKIATKPVFITVGSTSALHIKKYTNLDVINPIFASGQKALLTENLNALDLANKKILVIGGNGENNQLVEILKNKSQDCMVIMMYKKCFHHLLDDTLSASLKRIDFNGIIITTSILVSWLFKEAERCKCRELLQNTLFVVLHEQISRKLANYGAGRVLTTRLASREGITELLRSLHG